jgi:hypothetical protein
MPDTGAPWNIPYIAPTDNPRVYPAADEAQALAVAAGLTNASRIKQVKQVITTTDFTTTSATLVDLTGVTVTVVPSDAANRVVMFFMANTTNADNSRDVFFRFRRDTTDLFEEIQNRQEANAGSYVFAMMFDEVAGSTASRTYSVRVRRSGGPQTVLNSSLIVMEYAP